MYVIGIDVGGTHIDGVLLNKAKIVKFLKMPYDKTRIISEINNLIDELIKDVDNDLIERVHLSTTISTNTVYSQSGNKVNLIIESGPGMVNDFSHLDADIYYLSSYVNHQGSEIVSLKNAELKDIKAKITDKTNLGIVGKFSVRNPNHELKVKEYFSDFDFISMGHSISGNLNFVRRVDSVFLNNYVYKDFLAFANSIKARFKAVYVLKADGGTMPLTKAIKNPVETIMSGPAASFMGMKALANISGNGILFDIGGTTTDIFFVVDGKPLFEPKGININKYKTQIRSIYSYSLALGGDSEILYDGKFSFGARRGFAAGYGGKYPTLSDALIVLNKLDGDYDSAYHALTTLGDFDVKQISLEIVDLYVNQVYASVKAEINKINNQTVYTISEVLDNFKFKADYLVAIGGPALALKTYFEDKFNLNYYSPKVYAYANALGAALSVVTSEVNVIANTKLRKVVAPEFSYEKTISQNYNLSDATNLAKELLASDNVEIVEANSFNMVTYGSYADKNIRVKAQIMPALSYELKEHQDVENQ